MSQQKTVDAWRLNQEICKLCHYFNIENMASWFRENDVVDGSDFWKEK